MGAVITLNALRLWALGMLAGGNGRVFVPEANAPKFAVPEQSRVRVHARGGRPALERIERPSSYGQTDRQSMAHLERAEVKRMRKRLSWALFCARRAGAMS